MTTTIYMIVKYRMRGKRYHLNPSESTTKRFDRFQGKLKKGIPL